MEFTPATQWNFCVETGLRIDSVMSSLFKVNQEKEKLNIELLQKDGKIIQYEDKIRELLNKVKILEK